ncbi:CLUMA_CG016573, isoform A [Clunio marinus]|uniref:CLUMA_CG016573, isoform A n=1 Tax=Clunio marinus TaxID=568069 RepID=A0A1J1ITR5_9DIPT|nr:CLUMA_CG016573, isoform A [Clunio marinus]
MKYLIVFALVIVAALAAPPKKAPRLSRASDDSSNAQILKYENDNIGIDGYNFAYETSDGVSRQESAVVNNLGSENEEIAVKGTITWTAPDGQVITLNYIADKNGFQPQGDHIPV